eukprot:m.24200 g.24200  ORF g.24200 m.24200 type:complete len:67 (-) comp6039_c0_seq1:297-497(-)
MRRESTRGNPVLRPQSPSEPAIEQESESDIAWNFEHAALEEVKDFMRVSRFTVAVAIKKLHAETPF